MKEVLLSIYYVYYVYIIPVQKFKIKIEYRYFLNSKVSELLLYQNYCYAQIFISF